MFNKFFSSLPHIERSIDSAAVKNVKIEFNNNQVVNNNAPSNEKSKE